MFCLVEAVLLLTSIWLSFQPDLNAYQATVFLGQFLLIPGLASFFSRIVYGSYRWRRRALTTLGSVLSGVLLFVLITTGFAGLNYIAPENEVLPMTLFVLCIGGITVGLLFLNRKIRRRTVELEAQRWLAERHSGITPRERRWRNRGARLALWVPSLTVLMVLLFFPELSGIVSFVRHSEASHLPGYRVPIPSIWVVVYIDKQENGKSYLSGLAGHGLAFGVTPYLRGNPPLSSWRIGTEPYGQVTEQEKPGWLSSNEVFGTRVVKAGIGPITCLEYWPRFWPQPAHLEDSTRAFIDCHSSDRLRASFSGERFHVPAFYQMLENITPTK